MGRSSAFCVALALVVLAPKTAVAQEPPLSAPAERMASALHCPAEFAAARQPVLLVHGTAATGALNWDWNYGRALPGLGFDVCTVDLPAQSYEDIQPASEFVVHALRTIAARSGQKVDVVGHSQGTLQPRWAIRWWPAVRGLIDDYVSLSGPHRGTASADLFCLKGSCPPALWQMSVGSRFLGALGAGDETPGALSYTSIFSRDDELATPYTNSPLEGASNILVQDLCPGRRVTHFGMVYDAVANAAVMDALMHPGPADPARIPKAVCNTWMMPGADPVTALLFEGLSDPGAVGLTAAARQVEREPELAPYVSARAGETAAQIRLSVTPRRAVAGRLTHYGFRARAAGEPVQRATIDFAGRRVRTDARGRARIAARLVRPGLRRARATRTGLKQGVARVRVVRRPRR